MTTRVAVRFIIQLCVAISRSSTPVSDRRISCHSPVRTTNPDRPCHSPPRQALSPTFSPSEDNTDLINVALTWGLAKTTSRQGMRLRRVVFESTKVEYASTSDEEEDGGDPTRPGRELDPLEGNAGLIRLRQEEPGYRRLCRLGTDR